MHDASMDGQWADDDTPPDRRPGPRLAFAGPLLWTLAVSGTTAAVIALFAITRPGISDCYARHDTAAVHFAAVVWWLAAALLGLTLPTALLVHLSRRAGLGTIVAFVIAVAGGAIECVSVISSLNFCP